MPAYVMVLTRPRPDKLDAAARYSQATAPILAAAGGTVVCRGPVANTVAGESFDTGIVLQFEDAAAAAAFFDQEEYKALVPLRDEVFARLEIHIVG